jgi:hypothetical protein
MSSQESKRAAGRKSSSTEPMPAIWLSKPIAATSVGSIPLPSTTRRTVRAAVA